MWKEIHTFQTRNIPKLRMNQATESSVKAMGIIYSKGIFQTGSANMLNMQRLGVLSSMFAEFYLFA